MSDENTVLEARADALVADHESMLEELIGLRKKHKLSQKEIARRMGVKQPTVSAFERFDANPRLSTIRRYAMAVDALIETKVSDDCAGSIDRFDAVVSSAGGFVWGTPPTDVPVQKWSFLNTTDTQNVTA